VLEANNERSRPFEAFNDVSGRVRPIRLARSGQAPVSTGASSITTAARGIEVAEE